MRWSTRFLMIATAAATPACVGDARYSDAGAIDAEPADAIVAVDATLADAAATEVTSTVSHSPALGSLCGVGYDPVAEQVWVYPCSGAEVHGLALDGRSVGTIARPGESANDVDLAFAPAALVVGVDAVAAGEMIFVNGETGVAELHLPETAGS